MQQAAEAEKHNKYNGNNFSAHLGKQNSAHRKLIFINLQIKSPAHYRSDPFHPQSKYANVAANSIPTHKIEANISAIADRLLQQNTFLSQPPP